MTIADSPSVGSLSQRDFHHPYTPYKIQIDFMNALYETIDQGKIGIFESPTGINDPVPSQGY